MVISPTPLTDFTPVQLEPGGEKLITQYDMRCVEKAGVLKADFLGLRNLSILEEAIRYVKKIRGIEVNLDTIPLDDATTFAMLGRGETQGVFQLASPGMTRYLKELRPEKVTDIMAMVALYRPGPMESIPEYIARKNDPSRVTFIDERLRDVLDMSYGIITYQDDVLLTAIAVAGYDWGEADKLRKAMGKKIPSEMLKQKEKFINGALSGGMSQANVEELWRQIEPFASYGFGRAHACSYGMIAYLTAYMKANFPAEYMAALLSCESHDLDKVAANVTECEKMGIHVLPPDMNESFQLFGVVKGDARERIRFGLGAIKNVGTHIAEVIIEERKRGGMYKNIEDFLTRVRDKDLNKKSLESFVKCGAMDRWGERGTLLANTDRMLSFGKEIGEIFASSQNSLFGSALAPVQIRFDVAPPVSSLLGLAWEKELLGLYVTNHPARMLAVVACREVLGIADLSVERYASSEVWVCIAGIVNTIKKVITKKGSAMGFVMIEDATGSIEAVLFPQMYEKYKEVCEEGNMVAIVGKRDTKQDEAKILVERMARVTPATLVNEVALLMNPPEVHLEETSELTNTVHHTSSIQTPAMVITVPLSSVFHLKEIKSIVHERPGNYHLYIKICDERGSKMIDSELLICVDDSITVRIEALVGVGGVAILAS